MSCICEDSPEFKSGVLRCNESVDAYGANSWVGVLMPVLPIVVFCGGRERLIYYNK